MSNKITNTCIKELQRLKNLKEQLRAQIQIEQDNIVGFEYGFPKNTHL
jgi:hypothetical protein